PSLCALSTVGSPTGRLLVVAICAKILAQPGGVSNQDPAHGPAQFGILWFGPVAPEAAPVRWLGMGGPVVCRAAHGRPRENHFSQPGFVPRAHAPASLLGRFAWPGLARSRGIDGGGPVSRGANTA